MKGWQKLGLVALFVSGSACAATSAERAKSISAGYAICPAKEIVITDMHFHMGATTWNASCRGSKMTCCHEAVDDDGADISHCAAGFLSSHR